MSESAAKLIEAVERLHSCKATLKQRVEGTEHFDGQVARNGTVHTLTIEGHTKADICYAWSSAVEGSNKRRFYAVLKVPSIDSPEAAVRAAIVADHKAGRSA